MSIKPLILDNRSAEDIYLQALKLANKYCPEWINEINKEDISNSTDDPGRVILKLFSFLTKYLLGQFNQIPEKYCVSFFDFIGIEPVPAKPSTAPLTFNLAKGITGTVKVPVNTDIGASDIIFETSNQLNVVNTGMNIACLINPGQDKYRDYMEVLPHGLNEEMPSDKQLAHRLYLCDNEILNIKRPPAKFRLTIKGPVLDEQFFADWYIHNPNDENDNQKLSINFVESNPKLLIDFENVSIIEESQVNNIEGNWIYAQTTLSGSISLPQILSITADLTIEKIIPDSAIFNDSPVELKKGIYPFGKTPEEMDTLFVGSEEAFSKKESKITIHLELHEIKMDNITLSEDIELNWEFWNGNVWEIIGTTGIKKGLKDKNKPPIAFTKNTEKYNFADTTKAFTISGQVTFNCPDIKTVKVNEKENFWIRVKIEKGRYGQLGVYIETVTVKELLSKPKLKQDVIDAVEKKSPLPGIKDAIQEAVNNSLGELQKQCKADLEDCQNELPKNHNIENASCMNECKTALTEALEQTMTDLASSLKQFVKDDSVTKFNDKLNYYKDNTLPTKYKSIINKSSCKDTCKNALIKALSETMEPLIDKIKKSITDAHSSIDDAIDDKFKPDDILKTIIQDVLDQLITEIQDEGYSFAFKYLPPEYSPPYIKSMNVKFEYTGKAIKTMITYNNFKYKNIDNTTNNSFFPYTKVNETDESLYLGFDGEIKNRLITMFLKLKQVTIEDSFNSIIGESGQNKKWFYSKDGLWDSIQENAKASNEITNILIPNEITRQCFSDQDKNKYYWLKLEYNSLWERLTGIFTNTVEAANSITIQDEVLGSGSSAPNLTFYFARRPVLKDQLIEIEEPFYPVNASSDFDMKKNIRIKDGQIWIKWRQIDDFSKAGPLSRVYMLDRAEGKITFGDNKLGMIPPSGHNNIVARYYQAGDEKHNNLSIGIIKDLKTSIAGIESVTNNTTSSGGMDQESQNVTISQAPYRIKSKDRAVTAEDYEILAREAYPEIAMTKCLFNKGNIILIVVPHDDSLTPLPSTGLTDYIGNYLKQRMLITMSNRLVVLGPAYETIGVNVMVNLSDYNEAFNVKEGINRELNAYLNPLKGGKKGNGWDFGANVSGSEILGRIKKLKGVNYIRNIEVYTYKDKNNHKTVTNIVSGFTSLLQISENALPTPGKIEVIFVEGV